MGHKSKGKDTRVCDELCALTQDVKVFVLRRTHSEGVKDKVIIEGSFEENFLIHVNDKPIIKNVGLSTKPNPLFHHKMYE